VHVAKPYFVTPHAIVRFREHTGLDLADIEVIQVIQATLQEPGLPVSATVGRKGPRPELILTYWVEQAGRVLYLVTGPGEGEWPAVITVLNEGSDLHKKLSALDAYRAERGRWPNRYWSDGERGVVRLLRREGYTLKQCASILRHGHGTVWRHVHGLVGRGRLWTPDLIRRAADLWVEGRNATEIGRVIGRSPRAVAAQLARYRRENPEDKRVKARPPDVWTAKDLAEAVSMRAAGSSMAAIARAVGRTRGAVGLRLYRYRRENPGIHGLPVPPRRPRPWTEAEFDRAAKLRAKGWNYARIARKLGRTPAAVGARFSQVRKARLADPRGRRLAGLVGRMIREVRRHGIEAIPDPPKGPEREGVR
jgi:DNA-binding CsgD family transcriptional regulator